MSSDSLLAEEQSVGLLSETMEARAEHLKTRNYRSLYYFTTTLGAGMVIMVLTWLTKYRGGFAGQSDPAKEFNWHPFLMIFGMLFFYGQSILVYRTGRTAPKKRLKILHGLIHTATFIMAVFGLKAVFDSHNLPSKPIANLYSFHSWIGLTTVILFTGQLVVGFVSFLYPGVAKSLRQALLPVHVATGTALFILALISCMTGLTEKTLWSLQNDYNNLPSEGVLINFIALFITLFGVMVLYLVNESDYKRTNLPEDEVALSNTE